MNRRRFLKAASGLFVPCAFPAILRAQSPLVPGSGIGWTKAPAAAAGGYLVNEQCESGQGSWTTPAGDTTLNYAYTTAPAPLKGTKSFAAGGNPFVGALTFAGQSTVEMFFYFSTASTSADNFPGGLIDNVATGTNCAFAGYNHTTKVMNVACGATTVSTTGTISINTTYGVWLRYVKGSGANAFASIEFAVSPFTRVGSGANFVSTSTANATVNAATIELASFASTIVIFDNILVSTSSIPSNP